MSTKKLIGIIGAIGILLSAHFFAPVLPLTHAGAMAVGTLLAFLLLLVFESLPVVVSSLMIVALMPLIGAAEGFGNALTGYASPVIFFTLASFGIAAGFTVIPLSRRMLGAILKRFGHRVDKLLFAIMVSAAIVSSVVSNVPTCAIFMSIAISLLDLYQNPEDRKRSGRAFMIAIPVASMIGGMMTPAGSSINILAINLLEKLTGQTITFVAWMAAGIPLTIVIFPLAWYLMIKVYKPAPITAEMTDKFMQNLTVPVKMEPKERKMVTITAVMLVLWILSSWIPYINVMVVAVLGCCVLFLPGIEILDVKTFVKENSWESFFLVGTIISISNALIQNGVSDLIISAIPALSVSLPILIAITASFTFISLIVIPVAPSLVSILVLPVTAIAAGTGAGPALLVLTLALSACNCYLLPLDTVTLLTYGKGYYSMTDMAKSTAMIQVALILCMSLWLPLIGGLL